MDERWRTDRGERLLRFVTYENMLHLSAAQED